MVGRGKGDGEEREGRWRGGWRIVGRERRGREDGREGR